jgi:phosphatidylserine decarboxylase
MYQNSPHILENERTVTRIDGRVGRNLLSCYVVQIAGGSVDGIDSFVKVGQLLQKGSIFGMIRIGSQVDIICNWVEGMRLQVSAGDKVRAGETILISFPETSEQRAFYSGRDLPASS